MAETPQLSKQHAVPQEVFGVQFKLIGDLTVRQFAVLAAFGLVAAIIFSSGLPTLLRWLLTAIVALAGVAFALVPFQDQPLDQWVGTLIRAVYSPTRRIWEKSSEAPDFLTLEVPKMATPIEPGVAAEESRRRLKEFLAGVRQEELSPLDLAEQQILNQINIMARQMGPAAALAPAPAPLTTTAPTTLVTEEEPTPVREVKHAQKEEIEKVAAPVEEVGVLPELRFVEVQKVKERPSLASRINWAEQVYKVQRGETASYFAPRKNIRVGRRLTPIAISGSMVYAPVREQVIEPVVPPTLELPTLAPSPTPAVPPPPTPVAPPAPVSPPPPPVVIPEPEIKEPEKIKPVEIPPAAPKVEKPAPPPPAPLKLSPKPAPQIKEEKPKKVGEQPNVIFGIIHNPTGGALANTLLVLKNEKGSVVRAAKTNELGRFQVGPLSSGHYSLELPQSPYPFATIKIELTGEKTAEMDLRPQGS